MSAVVVPTEMAAHVAGEHPAHVLSAVDLRAYWRFEESVGYRMDSVHDAKMYSSEGDWAEYAVAGKVGGGLRFPGIAPTTHSTTGQAPFMFGGGAGDGGDYSPSFGAGSRHLGYRRHGWTWTLWYRVDAWVNATGNPMAKQVYIIWQGEDPATGEGLAYLDLAINGDGIRLGSWGPTVTLPWAPGVGAWTFLAVTYDQAAGAFALSVNDGAQTASGSGFTMAAFPYGYVVIEMNVGDAELGMSFDEFGHWGDKILTDAQISYLYNSGAGRAWPFTLPR